MNFEDAIFVLFLIFRNSWLNSLDELVFFSFFFLCALVLSEGRRKLDVPEAGLRRAKRFCSDVK